MLHANKQGEMIMNAKRIRWLKFLPLTVICFAPLAGADGPVKQDPYDLTFNDAFISSCSPFGYAFDIVYDGSITFQETLFFDNDGNLARIRTKFRVNGGLYKNSLDSSKYIDLDPGWGASNWVDWQTGEFVQAGAYTKVTVPGYGAVALGVGRISVDAYGVLTYSGKANFIEGDLALLCSILA
jgi:hypothetical protein